MRYRLMVCCLSLPRDEHSQQVTETALLVAGSAGRCTWTCLHIKYTHNVYALGKLPLIKQLAIWRIYWAKFQYTVSVCSIIFTKRRKFISQSTVENLNRREVAETLAWQWGEMQIESWIYWHSRIAPNLTGMPLLHTANHLLSLQAS